MKRRDAMTLMALAPGLAAFKQSSDAESAQVRTYPDLAPNEESNAQEIVDFFELLWRCDAPTLAQRDDAEAQLNERLIEFEPVWLGVDLNAGQVGAEARLRFQRACERRRALLCREAFASLAPSWTFLPPEGDAASQGRRARALGRVTLPENARVIYYSPELSRLYWQSDGESENVWRPSFRNSSAEIAPQPDDVELTFETPLVEEDLWELPLEAVEPNDANRESLGFYALVGLDDRSLQLPVRSPSQDASARTFHSFDLTLSEPIAEVSDDELAITLQIQYARAYDAFDSHRTPILNEDFTLCYRDQEGRLQRVAVEQSRQLQRNACGVTLQLRFGALPSGLRFEPGAVMLECCLPRFWAFFR